ncbi:MAG: T9SS type A sorting domain-containing protein [Muribaculaceae bacterium]|nr:T9SS type A sorting domain-containing protein [Muribaculaceae bacterium]
MKRTLIIGLFCAVLAVPSVVAGPDTVAQRMEQVKNADASVQGGVGRIYLTAGSNDAVFNIYSITGQLLRTVRVSADSQTAVEIPKGFYIVRCANQWSRKVVVR